MSWSSGRDVNATLERKKRVSDNHKRQLESIRQINGILGKFADDEDFQDDLKQPGVRLALDHWTGVQRLPPEIYAQKLENDRRVSCLHQKLMLLQAACNEAPMKVPLDHMIHGRRELDSYALTTTFGTDFCIEHELTRPQTPKNSPRKIDSIANKRADRSIKDNKNEVKYEQEEGIKHCTIVDRGSGALTSGPFSLWSIAVESCTTADWIGICAKIFRQQFLLIVTTLVIALLLGYTKFESSKPQ